MRTIIVNGCDFIFMDGKKGKKKNKREDKLITLLNSFLNIKN